LTLPSVMPKHSYSKKRGGGGASEFGVAAYGLPSQQHAASGMSNQIAVNPQPNVLRGGKRRSSGKHSKLGGSTLLDIAVPAALFAANHVYRPKKSSVSFRRKSRSNKFNRTRRMTRRFR
jgi:hypothetical protein